MDYLARLYGSILLPARYQVQFQLSTFNNDVTIHEGPQTFSPKSEERQCNLKMKTLELEVSV